MDQLLYWVWLSEKCAPDTPTFSILYHTFGSAKKIYEASAEELSSVYGITPKIVERLADKSTDSALAVLKQCKTKNIGILPYSDELFPHKLRVIKNPPVLLYYKGELPNFNRNLFIGTVGTRNPSSYGCRYAYEISFDLGLSGVCVVSGMALGIDSVCHKACLDAGGKTVAVLGSGVDVIYPKENTDLYNDISVRGTIISEYAPGTKATRYSFPQRNRIISGLSSGILIVEAQLKSGAMITAQKAIDQNKDIFALPGNLGEYNSLGPNSLIQKGAFAVTKAYDIIKEYEFFYHDVLNVTSNINREKNNPFIKTPSVDNKSGKQNTFSGVAPLKEEPIEQPELSDAAKECKYSHLPETEKALCMCLSSTTPMPLEEIARVTKLSVSDIMSSLTILEIKGIVNAMPGGSFLLV